MDDRRATLSPSPPEFPPVGAAPRRRPVSRIRPLEPPFIRAPSLQRAANAGQKETVTAIGVLPLAGVANIVAAARPTDGDILGARRASTAGPPAEERRHGVPAPRIR